MTRVRLFGIAFAALFVFGAIAAATASAAEPPGLLFLPGGAPPVTMKGTGEEATEIETPSGTLKCTANESVEELTKAEAEETKQNGHVQLIKNVRITLTGCKSGKVACSSENIKGEKAAKETVLAIDIDIHFVSLLNGVELKPGLIAILLRLKEEAKELDLTINCGGAKVLLLGVFVAEITADKGNPLEGDVTKFLVLNHNRSELIPCDKEDLLCKKLRGEFGFEESLGASFTGKYEAANFRQHRTFNVTPDVLIDF